MIICNVVAIDVIEVLFIHIKYRFYMMYSMIVT